MDLERLTQELESAKVVGMPLEKTRPVAEVTPEEVKKVTLNPDDPAEEPVNQDAYEWALKVTNSASNPTGLAARERFLDYVQTRDKAEFMKKYGLTDVTFNEWFSTPLMKQWARDVTDHISGKFERTAPGDRPASRVKVQPWVPDDKDFAGHVLVRMVGKNGNDMVAELMESPNPMIARLAQDLAKYR